MEEITVPTWEEFQKRVNDLPQETLALVKKHCPTDFEELQAHGLPENNFLYRGQGGETWKLSTTLERHTKKAEYSVLDYVEKLRSVWDEFSSQFPNERPKGQIDFKGLRRDLMRRAQENMGFDLPDKIYETMATLRHFGLPSPLLDWTNSQDVAAFFAFSEINSEDYVSLFVYSEMPLGIKAMSPGEPYILSTRGPEATIPRPIARHTNQQAEHTLCIKKDSQEFYFCSHESLPDMVSDHWDLLWKFHVPQVERMKVLDQLRAKKITKSALFDSPDDLIRELTEKYFR